jgi:hypothetical protein
MFPVSFSKLKNRVYSGPSVFPERDVGHNSRTERLHKWPEGSGFAKDEYLDVCRQGLPTTKGIRLMDGSFANERLE